MFILFWNELVNYMLYYVLEVLINKIYRKKPCQMSINSLFVNNKKGMVCKKKKRREHYDRLSNMFWIIHYNRRMFVMSRKQRSNMLPFVMRTLKHLTKDRMKRIVADINHALGNNWFTTVLEMEEGL